MNKIIFLSLFLLLVAVVTSDDSVIQKRSVCGASCDKNCDGSNCSSECSSSCSKPCNRRCRNREDCNKCEKDEETIPTEKTKETIIIPPNNTGATATKNHNEVKNDYNVDINPNITMTNTITNVNNISNPINITSTNINTIRVTSEDSRRIETNITSTGGCSGSNKSSSCREDRKIIVIPLSYPQRQLPQINIAPPPPPKVIVQPVPQPPKVIYQPIPQPPVIMPIAQYTAPPVRQVIMPNPPMQTFVPQPLPTQQRQQIIVPTSQSLPQIPFYVQPQQNLIPIPDYSWNVQQYMQRNSMQQVLPGPCTSQSCSSCFNQPCASQIQQSSYYPWQTQGYGNGFQYVMTSPNEAIRDIPQNNGYYQLQQPENSFLFKNQNPRKKV